MILNIDRKKFKLGILDHILYAAASTLYSSMKDGMGMSNSFAPQRSRATADEDEEWPVHERNAPTEARVGNLRRKNMFAD